MLIGLMVNAERMRLTAWVVKRAVYTIPAQLNCYRRIDRHWIVSKLIGYRHFCSKRKTWNDQSRIYLQALGVDIDKIDKVDRKGVSWSIQQMRPTIKILLQADLDKNTISQIITHKPSILNMELKALEIRLTFLKSLGLNRNKLAELLSDQPLLLTYQESDIQQLLTFLQSRDLNKFKAWQVILSCPTLITGDVNVFDQILNLLRESTMTENQINDIIIHHSSTLLLPYQQLKDLLHVMTIYLSDVAALKQVIFKYPSVLQLTPVAVTNVAEWLNQSLGLSNESICLLFQRYPQILEINCKSLATAVANFQSLGIDLKLTGQILFSEPAYFKYDYNFITNKFQTLFNLKFTEKQVKTILGFNPSILQYNEDCIQQKCNYLIKEMGYSHQVIVENAAVLSCSLDKIATRWSRWRQQSNNQQLISPAKLLLTSDCEFEKDILQSSYKIKNQNSIELCPTESQKVTL